MRHGHHGHGHGPGPARGFGPRGSRLIDAGLLLLLSRGPSYGYPLIQALQDELGLDVPDVGAVYRALRRQEALGLLTSTWEVGETRPKRVYTITPLGEEVLGHWMGDIAELRSSLDRLYELWKGGRT